MTHESTITVERRTPKIARVTFANPPANLIVSETVTRLDEILRELDGDPDIQVVVFTSGVPDFFFNHFDLAALSLVAFLPFPTQVFGEHTDSRAAVIFYAVTVALLGALITGSLAYDCYDHRLIRTDTPDALVRHSLWRGAIVVAVFALSIPVAFIDPRAAEWFWLLLVPARFVLHRVYGSIAAS